MWTELFGDQLLVHSTKQSSTVPTSTVLEGKVIVGLYFSAHWCTPCREFTPVLAAMYAKVVALHPEFEIVYISSDQSPGQFDATFDSMPFPALPYVNRDIKAELVASFNVPWVPFLVFVDAVGNVIERDGRRLFVSAKSVDTVWDSLSNPAMM
ncbi:hypothetical protein H257_19084 [Aphanomyces astaci]|uniref:protein-disulfide reductase n=2 Tax=Aphanomyces astaci TaxID=112090 RepID=W4F952_APHAT|nr:hypothetical protein H257_19084 [Aphanomyces astaci]ETV63982.1 hypothetical protein H257_19084 [Aphanomyces astaci]|eukprot:XP_009846536.1 hypothetical protein H257_19084 [Aphanomyces astaci]